MIKQIAYVSRAVKPWDDASLRELLRQSRRDNARAGLTGLLLYQAPHFLQVLEGESSAVDAVLERIRRDPRHCDFELIIDRQVPEREFSRWRMACQILGDGSADELRELDHRVRRVLSHAASSAPLARHAELVADFRRMQDDFVEYRPDGDNTATRPADKNPGDEPVRGRLD